MGYGAVREQTKMKVGYVLDYVNEHIEQNGYPPSVREICAALGYKSTSTVHIYLKALEDEGKIIKSPSKPRTLRVMKGYDSDTNANTDANANVNANANANAIVNSNMSDKPGLSSIANARHHKPAFSATGYYSHATQQFQQTMPQPASARSMSRASQNSAGLNTNKNSGVKTGINAGMASGVNTGTTTGVNTGIASGVNTGMASGINAGMASGVNSGINSGINSGMNLGLRNSIGSSIGINQNKGSSFGSNQNRSLGAGINKASGIGMNTGIGAATGLDISYPAAIEDTVFVPVVGRITAGRPILAVENIEYTFPVPTFFVNGSDVFMLKVEGDSMINAGIFDRDYILVRHQPTAQNGDIVVALIEDEATVKTFYKERNRIRLQPENERYSPIYATGNCTVVGKVIGIFRKL